MTYASSQEIADQFERLRRMGVTSENCRRANENRRRMSDLVNAMDSATRAIRDLHIAGADSLTLADALASLLDAAHNAEGTLAREIDDCGQWVDDLDFSDAETLLVSLKGA